MYFAGRTVPAKNQRILKESEKICEDQFNQRCLKNICGKIKIYQG
jgi:hypothetical protein